MLSILNPSDQLFVDNLDRVSKQLLLAERQVSTGLKITQVSDAPDSVSLLLQARATLASTQQTLTNLGRTQTEVNAGETALENATTLFDNVQTLATEGNTDTQTASGRADIAQQLGAILQQFVGIAGTQVEGRYIFSGDKDQSAPYTYDTTSQTVSSYQGAASTRLAVSPNGTTFPVALTAQKIFDSSDPATNVFSSIENLITALNQNDSTAISNASNGLQKISQYLNSQLAFYGTTQNNVTAATSFGTTYQTELQTQISDLSEADLTTAILEETQAQTQQQAALQARAQIPRTTLFDFLG